MWLGGRENEDDVRRRLFERLEQGVERLLAEHMDLIDDEDLVNAFLGRNTDRIAHAVHVFNAIVRGGVEFDDVERGTQRFPIHRIVDAVDHAGQNPRHRGFSNTPRTAEQIGMIQPFLFDRVPKRIAHMFL